MLLFVDGLGVDRALLGGIVACRRCPGVELRFVLGDDMGVVE